VAERRSEPTHLYGPVPSRRLGYSLGVDILPFKTCSLDCVYCQLGSGPKTTVRRAEFVPARAVLAQVRKAVASGRTIDAITFSGSGEPTLNSGIGTIIRGIKRFTRIPVVVLTNSSCLASPGVRRDLRQADIVVPSLDAADEAVFRKVNRPHAGLTAAAIIAGLAAFRREFAGQIWLEIMLVRGVNDGPRHLKKLKAAAALIRPDRIQLNTVVRPPAEKSARPLGPAEMEKIREFFGDGAEIIADFNATARSAPAGDAEAAVLAVVGRRPVTAGDLSLSLGRPRKEIEELLRSLGSAGKIRSVVHRKKIYWEKV
jgi:wyosine [tRNA(Phe)-imidazoG37] synthetase (radical SAM superfamily)